MKLTALLKPSFIVFIKVDIVFEMVFHTVDIVEEIPFRTVLITDEIAFQTVVMTVWITPSTVEIVLEITFDKEFLSDLYAELFANMIIDYIQTRDNEKRERMITYMSRFLDVSVPALLRDAATNNFC